MVMEKFVFMSLLLLFKGGDLSVHHRYYLIQQGKTWSEAQAFCRSTYHDLATVQSPDDLVQLQNETQRYLFSSSAWIGLWNDVNSWRWSLGNKPLGIWSKWVPGQPDNGGGIQECTIIKPSGFWSDDNCGFPWPFICFDATKNGSDRYIVYPTPATWYGAQSYCRQHHTDLASSRDSVENTAIRLKVNGSTFFGLFRDSWKWSDQTQVSRINWKVGQPDNGLGNESCAFVLNGQAADGNCSVIRPFFCHGVATLTQTLRVKVLTDQDVNDPQVKAASLQQIKQKLKEQGMENVTMSWRERPGGAVFEKLENN